MYHRIVEWQVEKEADTYCINYIKIFFTDTTRVYTFCLRERVWFTVAKKQRDETSPLQLIKFNICICVPFLVQRKFPQNKPVDTIQVSQRKKFVNFLGKTAWWPSFCVTRIDRWWEWSKMFLCKRHITSLFN